MKEKKWDIYVYGDINIDLVIPGVESLPQPGQEDIVDKMDTFIGGGAALFTLGVGKLGLNPVFQGKIGNDFYGEWITQELKNNHVDTSMLTVSKQHKTGISISFTNESDRSFLTYRGTNEEIELESIDLDALKKASHIHITGYSGQGAHEAYYNLLKRIKEIGNITVSFDLGWDDSGQWYQGIYELFPYIDVLFMNETEAIHYSRKETAKEAIIDFGKTCSLVVIKLGKKGAVAFSDGIMQEVKGYTVKAVDTTGAGDSFNAGFIYGFLSGKNVIESIKCGNGCGALSVTAYGGNTGFPSKQELDRFIKEQG